MTTLQQNMPSLNLAVRWFTYNMTCLNLAVKWSTPNTTILNLDVTGPTYNSTSLSIAVRWPTYNMTSLNPVLLHDQPSTQHNKSEPSCELPHFLCMLESSPVCLLSCSTTSQCLTARWPLGPVRTLAPVHPTVTSCLPLATPKTRMFSTPSTQSTLQLLGWTTLWK